MIFSRRLVDPVFKAEILVTVCSMDDLRSHLGRRFPGFESYADVTFRAAARGKVIEHTHDNGVVDWLIWFPTWERSDRALQILAHESLHLCAQILRHRGVVLTRDSEETYAYYLDWIFSAALARLDESALKHKAKRKG